MLSRLRDLNDWKLQDSSQDIRGKRMITTDGRSIGTVRDLLVDRDTEHVEMVVLDNGQNYWVRDLDIDDGSVRLHRDARPMTLERDEPVSSRESTGPVGSRETAGHHEEVARIPVIEEQVSIGKRPVTQGVTIRAGVAERPVEEHVHLREERIHVETQKADRPATQKDIEMSTRNVNVDATSEQPLVEKTQRVVEEIVITKDVGEHTATIRDTERKTKIEVDDEKSKKERR